MLTLVLAASVASTATAPQPPVQPLWEAGAFGLAVHQQAYPGADQSVHRGLVLPYLLYRGRWFRADGETAGLRAVHTPRVEFDIGFAGSFGSGQSEIAARRGMPDLGTLVELGPRLKVNLGGSGAAGQWRLLLPVRSVRDLSERLQHRGWAAEPALEWRRRLSDRAQVSLGLGAVWADRALAQHFYGVTAAQAQADRPAYSAQAGRVATRLSSGFSWTLSPDLRLFGTARWDTVAGSANRASPLVRQTDGWSVGLGLSYTFARSSEPGVD